MAIVCTHGKVKNYVASQNKLICKVQPPTYRWKGNTVRTSGSKPSICNIQTMIFDVTVDEETADKLVADYVFLFEYDDRHHAGLKEHERLVTTFAGYRMPDPEPAACLPGDPTTPPSP
jgi:hypothetical protein